MLAAQGTSAAAEAAEYDAARIDLDQDEVLVDGAFAIVHSELKYARIQCAQAACANNGGLTCSRCKLVKYCCKECQIIAHPYHVAICRAFKEVRHGAYLDPMLSLLRKLLDTRWRVAPDIPLSPAAVKLLNMIRKIEDKAMKEVELTPTLLAKTGDFNWQYRIADVLRAEPRCLLCMQASSDTVQLETRCPLCQAPYCSIHHCLLHEEQHQTPSEHYAGVSQCDIFRRMGEHDAISKMIDRSEYGRRGVRDRREAMQWQPRRILSSTDAPEIDGWTAYFAANPIPDRYAASFFTRYALPALSIPLTILAALPRFYPNGIVGLDDVMNVHIIGAEAGLGYEGTHCMLTVEELLHQLVAVLPGGDGIKRIVIDMYGPCMPDTRGRDATPSRIKRCDPCNKAGRSIVIRSDDRNYHQAFQDPEYRKPHLAVCFNAIFDGYPEWQPSLICLIGTGIPTVATAFSSEDARVDYETLCTLAAHVEWHGEKHPFPGRTPRFDPLGDVDGFSFVNAYWTGFRGRERDPKKVARMRKAKDAQAQLEADTETVQKETWELLKQTGKQPKAMKGMEPSEAWSYMAEKGMLPESMGKLAIGKL